jgi:hypothetical protein
MIPDFNATPMIPNRLKPLLGRFGFSGFAAEVKTVIPITALLFTFESTPHMDDGAHMWKVQIQRFYGLYGDLALSKPTVFLFR